MVPSFLRTVLNKIQDDGCSLPHLKYWISSGEMLPSNLVSEFYKAFPSSYHKLLNIYGSSEVSADVTCYDTSKVYKDTKDVRHMHIPIGKPIANINVYIVDKNEHLVPQGVVGEICVAGVQVAQGYLNMPELTSERFINDPYSMKPDTPMFKTGDYGRWLSDGNIEYLGRIDDQVKISGNRIELAEVEKTWNNVRVLSKELFWQKKTAVATND